MQPRAIAYHPALPTVDAAKENYNAITSDHVPLIATIPLSDKSTIKILSWNVLESDSFNGFSPLGTSKYDETEEQQDKRYDRIAESLTRATIIHAPDFICLQELSSSPGSLFDLIDDELSQRDYTCMSFENKLIDFGGNITFYNTKKFNPNINSTIRDKNLNGSITQYDLIDSQQKIQILNCHSEYNRNPEHHENNIAKFLNESADENKVSIVIGDFNCTIAPLQAIPQNITTNVGPSQFRNNKIQSSYAIDGCFYSHLSKKNNIIIHQAETHPINPTSGEIYSKNDLMPINVNILNALQKSEIMDYRMIISVDDSYTHRKMVDNKWTIFQYQERLKMQFNETLMENIVVRSARNLNNQEGLGLALKRNASDLYNCIRLAFNPNITCKLMDDTIASTQYFQIITDRDHQHELIQLINRIAENKKLLELAHKITLLGKNKNISVAVDHAYKNLFHTLIDNKTDLKNPSHEIIIDHFTTAAEKLLENPNPSLESIDEMNSMLEKKLCLKPPLSTKMKAAICGIIGALIGAAIGIGIGMLCLGIGAIPGAIVGAFKGFTTGTAVAIGTVSAGAAIGAGIGFFSAKRNNEAYQNILTATSKIHNAHQLQNIQSRK